GRCTMRGPGAGGIPTSSAVLGDLLAVARGVGSTWAGLPPAEALPAASVRDGLDGERRWLIADTPGGADSTDPRTLRELRRVLGAAGWQGTIYPLEPEA
ncbi:MAG: hypothetical protein ACXWPJ_04930, partial [Candidatus Limnocylindrales bacterium]